LAISRINGDQCSAGFQGLSKECLENIFLVTIFGWVLFPDERVASHGVELMEMVGLKGPEFEEWTY
jgi:hypothetical protein